MDTQGGESLCSSLTEPDIADLSSLGNLQNMVYGIGNVVPSEIVNTIGKEASSSLGTRESKVSGIPEVPEFT